MRNEGAPRIVSADRFDEFIIVGFSDGREGRYPAGLLYSLLAREDLDEPASTSDFDELDGSAK